MLISIPWVGRVRRVVVVVAVVVLVHPRGELTPLTDLCFPPSQEVVVPLMECGSCFINEIEVANAGRDPGEVFVIGPDGGRYCLVCAEYFE